MIHERTRRLGYLAASILVSFVCYWRVVHGHYNSDDSGLIFRVHQHGALAVFTDQYFLRPIVALSLWTDVRLWGIHNASAFHITNIVIQGVNVFMVGALAYRLASTTRLRAAPVGIVAGVLFAVLPAHAESVSWISGRTDLIATLFALAAIHGYLTFRERHSPRFLVGAFVMTTCAMLSKESVLTLPIVFIVIDLLDWLRDRRTREHVMRVLPWVLLLPAYCAVRYAALGSLIGGYGESVHTNFAVARILEGLASEGRVLFPAPLLGLFGAALVVLLVRRAALRQALPELNVGILLVVLLAAVIALLPVINFPLATTWQGTRVVYFPSVFTSVLVALLVASLGPRLELVMGAVGLVVTGLLFASLSERNQSWYDAGQIGKRISQQVAAQLESSSARSVYVVHLPDNYKDAYIFRNSFRTSLIITGGVDPRLVGERLVFIRKESDEGLLASYDPRLDMLIEYSETTQDLVITSPAQ